MLLLEGASNMRNLRSLHSTKDGSLVSLWAIFNQEEVFYIDFQKFNKGCLLC